MVAYLEHVRRAEQLFVFILHGAGVCSLGAWSACAGMVVTASSKLLNTAQICVTQRRYKASEHTEDRHVEIF